jgi:hypothetical protein
MMTAIFAYSDDSTAFIAADTMRVDKTFSSIARKAHRWSDAIVFAQTGAGKYLGELAAQMMSCRDQHVNYDLRASLVGLFSKFRQNHYLRAVQDIGLAKAGGRFVVACAGEGSRRAEILTLEFATGQVTSVAPRGEVYADGTDQVSFDATAKTLFAGLKGRAIQLDDWAFKCLDAAAAVEQLTVGWPADLVIAREDPLAKRLTIIRRVQNSSAARHSLYCV